MKLRWLTTPCLIFGSCLVMVGGAQAFGAAQSPVASVSWESMGMLGLGLVMSLVSAYVKGLHSRIGRNEQKLDKLSETLLGDHYDKHEAAEVIASAIKPVQRDIEHMGKTLDAIALAMTRQTERNIRRDAEG